jgi:hypothetical protein
MPNFNNLKDFKHKKTLMVQDPPFTRHRSYPIDYKGISVKAQLRTAGLNSSLLFSFLLPR